MKNILLALAVAGLAVPVAQAQPGHRTPLGPAGGAAARQTAATFNLTVDLEQVYRNSRWKDTLRTTNSRFNAPATLAGGRVVPAQPARIFREQSVNGTTWSPTRRRHRLYNAANGVVSDTSYSFNAATGAATARFMSATTYNAAGDIAQAVSRVSFAGSWQNSGRDTYTYDAQGRLVRILLEGATGSGFYDAAQTLYAYNAQGQAITVEDQQADGSGTGWLPFFKDFYTYDPQGRVAVNVTQAVPPNASAYQNYSRETYAYDAANGGRLQATVLESWNGAWTVIAQYLWRYATDGTLAFLTTERATSPTTFVSSYRHAYFYQTVTGTQGPAAWLTLPARLVAAPNPAPAGRAATLHYTLPAAAPVAVAVFDLTGRTVAAVPASAQAAGDHALQLPALPQTGLYLVRLSAGSQQQTIRLAVE